MVQTPEVKKFLEDKDIRVSGWAHTDKGHSALASLVETCVKMAKRALAGSVGRNVLEYWDFELHVQQKHTNLQIESCNMV